MATFAAKTFNAAAYLAARPVYPSVLYDTIYAAHRGRFERALDLGAGSGQVTRILADRFSEKVYAADPSEGMLEKGKADIGTQYDKIEWHTSSAEDLSWLEDESIDLVTAGQAAHWFNHQEVWQELRRVLRPNGSVAFWAYGDMRLPEFPSTTHTIMEYMYNDPSKLGPHWEQPGRDICCSLLERLPWPANPEGWAWDSRQRVKWDGDQEGSKFVLKRDVTWEQLEGYGKTFSSLHNYKQANPEDASNPDGDVLERLIKELKRIVHSEKPGVEKLELAWPLGLMFISKCD